MVLDDGDGLGVAVDALLCEDVELIFLLMGCLGDFVWFLLSCIDLGMDTGSVLHWAPGWMDGCSGFWKDSRLSLDKEISG